MAPNRKLAYVGFGWALSYLPIHLYWALGGLTRSIGITGSQPGFRAANWGASVVIVGAGLTCLAMEQQWGQVLPRGLRHGTAWVGGVFGIGHWLVFSAAGVLQLAGVIGFPKGELTQGQQRNFDWANLAYFEPWFGVMGVLLIWLARRSAARERLIDHTPTSATRRVGTALTLAGLATVLWGVLNFDAWMFAGYGPAVLGLGLLTLIVTNQTGTENDSPKIGLPGRGLGDCVHRTAHLLGDRTH